MGYRLLRGTGRPQRCLADLNRQQKCSDKRGKQLAHLRQFKKEAAQRPSGSMP